MESLNADIGSFLELKSNEGNRPDLIYGFADITNVSPFEENGSNLTKAISIACALDPAAVSSLSTGLTTKYVEEYLAVSDFLNLLSQELVDYLKGKGYIAATTEKPLPDIDAQDDARALSKNSFAISPFYSMHRVCAAHAGLGWVGKNGLIVTKHFGSAVLLSTIFTDAPIDCATEVFLSRCGRCKECADACPASAIDISKRTSLRNIEDMVDIEACSEQCRKQTLELFGKAENLCGICIYACPYTKSYLRRKGYPYE